MEIHNRKHLKYYEHISCVGLSQLVRFLVVELIYPVLNPKFDMSVVFMTNYSFSGRRRPHQQRDALGHRLCVSQDQYSRSSRLSLSEVLIGIGCMCVCHSF
jgi:hypothetical protein